MPPAVLARGVRKRFGPRTVLDGADLAVPPGELHWLSGDNGAGKTTLLRILSGVLEADEGEVRVGDLAPGREYRRRLGVLPAGDRGLYARLSVVENLRFVAALALLPTTRERTTALERAIDRFALQDMTGQRVDRLSMGQRQRVRLAATFLHEPQVVLLDEPRTSLDDTGIELLHTALRDLLARGGAALWCSPRGDRPQLDIDRSLVLRAGRVEVGA